MRRLPHALRWTPLGSGGSIALGAALMPLREFTSTPNLSFAFLPLTILVAALRGRNAAIVTAITSALSIAFFLAPPIFSFSMSKPDDAVAFVALLGCGLIAASFGEHHERRRSEEALRQRGDDGQAMVEVRDCGRGIESGQAERVFEAFFSTKPNGLGVGLAISRSIVEAHGGRLWATPNGGPGVTLAFTLPGDSAGG